MSGQVVIPVPNELKNPFFFSNEHIIVKRDELIDLNVSHPFLYEAAFFSRVEAVKPWEIQDQSLLAVINEWQLLKITIENYYKNKEQAKVLVPMKRGICLFLQYVYWANGLPVTLSNDHAFQQLKIQPINLSERLQFIMKRPTLFQSYKQLVELMVETNKQYVKELAIKKASKHKA
ncbi:hypothetical protein F7731_01620 [Cytobacillus depressus]|uniref:YpoC-like domain-containing protein n=1 Tax=Cytobacillus depressus TaxID=1602942 RepID=A0A6L3VB41_9BACI|nr:hypothetical protein [Cytobacillus depressus]KAB2338289.1 hypothetical protein F7731_01620 [Cytobacillus depressus]